MDSDRPSEPEPRHQQPSRRSVRLTFRVSGGEIELVSEERLDMITPPQVGEAPQAGTHGGQWIELRDPDDRMLSYRLIDPTALNSVEVHSPDRTIERRFGDLRDGIFEVVLPDDEAATSAVLMGERLTRPKGRARRAEVSGELVRFELSGRDEPGDRGD